MIELYKRSLINQFHAALSMLHDCVSKCPDENWSNKVGNFPFWHVVYHAVFYTDLYLSRNEQSFTPPSFHRENYQPPNTFFSETRRAALTTDLEGIKAL